MVQTCIKCGTSSEECSDLIFFCLPSKTDFPDWYNEFVKHLGIEDSNEALPDELYICEKHFSSEDIELEGDSIRLRENALPLHDEEENDNMYLNPELVYCDDNIKDVRVIRDDDDEDQNAAHLEYDQDDESYEYTIQENIETEIIEEDDNEKVTLTNDNNQIINVISSESSQFVQPMMPFYLSDSSIFTIMNENNEVGETIILQIENSDPQGAESLKPALPTVKKVRPERDDFKIACIEKQLCRPKDDSLVHNYPCDICPFSYGCINCLKSHYETMHVAYSNVAHYKCKHAVSYTKGLCCPVCELICENRNDTLDHYITHSVACSICYSGFDRQLYLTEHMMTVHLTADSEVIYECELCKLEYHNSPALTKHYQAIHKMILCYICKIRFENTSQLGDHEKTHWKKLNVLPFACSKCNKAFAKISDIAVHIRQDHKKKVAEYSSDSTRNTVNEIKKNMADLGRVYIVTKDDVDLLPRKKVKVKK